MRKMIPNINFSSRSTLRIEIIYSLNRNGNELKWKNAEDEKDAKNGMKTVYVFISCPLI